MQFIFFVVSSFHLFTRIESHKSLCEQVQIFLSEEKTKTRKHIIDIVLYVLTNAHSE